MAAATRGVDRRVDTDQHGGDEGDRATAVSARRRSTHDGGAVATLAAAGQRRRERVELAARPPAAVSVRPSMGRISSPRLSTAPARGRRATERCPEHVELAASSRRCIAGDSTVICRRHAAPLK
jgi:hypothetical protein